MLSSLNRRSFVCLDIQANEVSLLHSKQFKKQSRIEAFISHALPSGTITEGKVTNFSQLVSILKLLVSQAQASNCSATIALPGEQVVSRQVTLSSSLLEKEVKSEIGMHLERYFPGNTDKVCMDYAVQHQDSHIKQVELVTAKLEILNAYVNAVNMSGLRTTIVDVDWYAFARIINRYTDSERVGLLDLSDDQARVIFILNKKIIYTSHSIINSHAEDLPQVLASSISQAFQSCFSPAYLDDFYMSGNNVKLNAIYERIKILLGIRVELIKLTSQLLMLLGVSAKEDFSSKLVRSLVSVGLLLRGDK